MVTESNRLMFCLNELIGAKQMKSTFFCVFACIALMFTSCGKGPDDIQKRFLTEAATPIYVIPGAEMSMLITEDSSLWGWGWYVPNLITDTGNTAFFRSIPMHMMYDVAHVSVGFRNKFIITTDNILYAWGENGAGQLGDGTTINRSSPVQIMEDVVAVSAGRRHTLAITNEGELWGWGNVTSHPGDGNARRQTPAHVMENIAAVAAGNLHSLALSTSGVVWEFGPLWYGFNVNVAPVAVIENVTAIAVNDIFSFAITVDDVLYVWPAGVQDVENSLVARIEDVIAISAADINNFVITTCYTLWDLGDFSVAPVLIMENVTSVHTGEGRNLAITQDGSMWSWGTYYQGYRHPGSYTIFEERPEPTQIMCTTAGFVPDSVALLGRWIMQSSTCEDRDRELSVNPLAPNSRQLLFQENGVLYITSVVSASGFVNYFDEYIWEIATDGQRLLIVDDKGYTVYDFVITRGNNSAGIFNILTLSAEEYTDRFVRARFIPLPKRLRE